jgi:3-deoxy-D-manno-octulosonic-acid transferase
MSMALGLPTEPPWSLPRGLPWGLRAWRLLTGALSPAAGPLLRRRAARGKEDWTRLNERLGISGQARPDGRLVWVHGASVGESLSALPLIEKLLEDATVLVTSGTVTSAAMMSQRLPQSASGSSKRALHQFVPLDTPGAVARFLDHWKPDAGLLVESDLWPNLILAAKARGISLALVNARISARSADRWRWASKSVATLLAAFDMVLAQDDEIAARWRNCVRRLVSVPFFWRHRRIPARMKPSCPPMTFYAAAFPIS